MKKKGFTPEQIITMLREAEVLLSQGSTTVEVAKKLGVTEQTYYRWRREYGGMKVDQRQEGSRSSSGRTHGSGSSWPISRWTTPFSKRYPGETSKPVPKEAGSHPRLRDPPCLRTTGVQGPRPAAVNAVSPAVRPG